MPAYHPIPLNDIRAARERITGHVIRTPLIRLNYDDTPAEIYLKLENLQPIGSFKIRGAYNSVVHANEMQPGTPVWTASAGNMAQGVAWSARQLGVPATVVVPDSAPETKLAAIQRYGADTVRVPRGQMEEIFRTGSHPGMEGMFIHAFSSPEMMAGNGVIGLEILEDLPDVDTLIIPWGGGGLSSGIASAVRALKPDVRLYVSEVDTAAPLSPSLASEKPLDIDTEPSFVDGIGLAFVLPEMFDLATGLLDGAIVTSLANVSDAIRLMVERNHVVAEGAAATAVAAALSGEAGGGKVVCVVSGGNIDSARLATILQGGVP